MQRENLDIQHFNKLFGEYQQRFIYFAISYLRNQQAAEDIVMESFMYYWENRTSIVSSHNIPAYILTIIKNKCLNYLRSESLHQKAQNLMREHNDRLLQVHITSLEACDPQELFSEDARKIIDRVLEELPDNTSDIFIRSRYKNESYREIASALGITERTVEFHITKALKELRIALKDYFPLLLFLLFNK